MKKIVWLVLLIAVVVIGGAVFMRQDSSDDFESGVRVKSARPVSLIGEFKSFQSPNEVTKWLSLEKLAWEVISDNRLSESDTRPDFSEYSIKIPEFFDLNTKGVLELNFINGRLYKAVFYPGDYRKYLTKLEGRYGTAIIPGKPFEAGDTTKIESGENHKGSYIQWVDIPLENEVTEWIRRFSYAPDGEKSILEMSLLLCPAFLLTGLLTQVFKG